MRSAIHFWGAAGTVTGSKYLVEAGDSRFLVDCGLFQGIKELRQKNWLPLPMDPRAIDAVILTHAHLDHTGYLPLLVKHGFKGKIFCTSPTRDLTRLVLLDSAHLQEEDAEYANRKGFTKHSPAEPLYTIADAQKTISLLTTVQKDVWTALTSKIKFRYRPSGHILGSAFIELEIGKRRIVFSGDLGRSKPLLLPAPTKISEADFLLIESTYGDRTHEKESVFKLLSHITNETTSRKGVLLIPCFAIGRTQDLLYCFTKLRKEGKIANLPVFVDSPMGVNATEIFLNHPDWHRLPAAEAKEMIQSVVLVKDRQQSKALLSRRGSAIIIAGSGMVTGGRILHHLSARVGDSRNTVLLVGFQAAGTRGRLLRDGVTELKIHGEYLPVKANVSEIGSLSAHADQPETIHWLKGFKTPPKTTFVVHGEPQASDALRLRIEDTLNWNVRIPALGECFEL